ncbi:hypothetical protein [Nonomuraea rosea]|uniref:hypothetical protein n=1 Tax=Nonomuraea rosea TaxID=638574 RepID=UPI0031EC7178
MRSGPARAGLVTRRRSGDDLRSRIVALTRPGRELIDQAFTGGFIGLLRPALYERLLAALPPGILQVNRQVDSFEQDVDGVRPPLADGGVHECDVIDSVRRTLWARLPKGSTTCTSSAALRWLTTSMPSMACAF